MDSVIFFELLITVGVVAIQAWSYLRTRQRTRVLANLFPGSTPIANVIPGAPSGSETNEAERHPRIEPTGQVSAGFRAILDATNQYLKKNVGVPAHFHILQGIAERVSDSSEYEASANATLPLYMGLMGTFIGVIVGLITIAQEPSSTIGDADLKRFLGGVLVAMVGSLCGLLLTVLGRVACLQPARAQNDTRKQSYYILLESELLPAVGLDASAELHTLQANLHQFNVDFRSNLGLFTDAMKIAVSTMKQQRELLDTLNKAKIAELIATNVELLTKVQAIATVFSEFVAATAELQKRIALGTDVAEKLNALFDRIYTFEQSINALGDKLSIDQTVAMRTVKLVEEQLETLKRRNQVITQYADVEDEELKSFFSAQREKLSELANKASQQLDELALEISRSVAEAFGTERTTQLVADVSRLKAIDDHIRIVESELHEWRLSAPQQEIVRAFQQFAQARKNGSWFTGWFKREVVLNSPKRPSDSDAPEDRTS